MFVQHARVSVVWARRVSGYFWNSAQYLFAACH